MSFFKHFFSLSDSFANLPKWIQWLGWGTGPAITISLLTSFSTAFPLQLIGLLCDLYVAVYIVIFIIAGLRLIYKHDHQG